MYEEHPAFTPPPREATLWRYMDFTKFVSLLDKSSLFFCSADRLGDPFEGSWSQVNFETMSERYPPEVAETIRQAMPNIERLRGRHLINCGHWNGFESDAMWKIYTGQSVGIAIKTDFASLSKSFIGDNAIYIGKVNYVDYNNSIIPEGNLFYAYLHKRNHFEHEREVRAIMSDTTQRNGQHMGRYCQVDLSILVHQVIVSPLAPEWFSQLVNSVATKYSLQAPVITSSLSDLPSWD